MSVLNDTDKISSIIMAAGEDRLSKFAASKALMNLLMDENFLRKFKKKGIRLFVDMDGVITDWKRQYKDFGGKDFKKSEDIDWSLTDKFPFWSSMEWMEEGPELWMSLTPLSPVILSSPGKSDFAREGKGYWIHEHLGESQPYVLETRKARYADGRSILIDDMAKNTDAWEEAGGVAIRYKGDPAKTAREIYKKVMDL